jgi:hypothetical protein
MRCLLFIFSIPASAGTGLRFPIFDIKIANQQSIIINRLILPFKRCCANDRENNYPAEPLAFNRQPIGSVICFEA